MNFNTFAGVTDKIRSQENFHVVLWLLKDFAWIMGFQWLGVLMAVPTVVLAVYICWKFRKIWEDFVHYLAICFWILGNVIWMYGEFFQQDSFRPLAKPFFVMGLLIVAIYYIPWSIKRVISQYQKLEKAR